MEEAGTAAGEVMAVVVGLCRRVERDEQNVELWPKKRSKVDLCHACEGRLMPVFLLAAKRGTNSRNQETRDKSACQKHSGLMMSDTESLLRRCAKLIGRTQWPARIASASTVGTKL